MTVGLFGVRRLVLDVDGLELPTGSLTVVVGPSGCGKSTLLSLVAGLAVPDRGRVELGGRDVTDLPPGARDVAMVFQDFALYPHMTVAQNVAFGLRLADRHGRGPGREESARRVAHALARLELAGLEDRRPAELSGGERQRVALARAIVRRRSVLLLDEPLSGLDAQLRERARAELVRLHRDLGATVVLVTHDQAEALSVATHLVVLRAGRVMQAGQPRDVYGRPAQRFVGEFLGGLNVHRRGEIDIGWRPGDGRLEPSGTASPGFDGVVDVVEFTGGGRVVRCTGPDGAFAVTEPAGRPEPAVGDPVRAVVAPAALHRFDARTGVRLPA